VEEVESEVELEEVESEVVLEEVELVFPVYNV
jgi:hypothetical protein